MARSAYSLILSDDVVEAVDREAARLGTSRSGLIDGLLAEAFGLSTMEKQMRDILTVLEGAMSAVGLRGQLSSGGTLTLRTALAYKYNPALSYVVELKDTGDGYIGELRVALRSQNTLLLEHMQGFFRLWAAVEQRHLPGHGAPVPVVIEPKRMLRTLRKPAAAFDEDGLAGALGAYVTLLDGCIKAYFEALGDPAEAAWAVESRYRQGAQAMGLAREL